MYIMSLGLLTPTTLAAHKKSSNAVKPAPPKNSPLSPVHVRRSYAMHDHATRFVMPLCSAVKDRPNPDVPITKQVIIADITGLGIMSAWKMRDWVQGMGQLLSTNYPEVLDAGLVSDNIIILMRLLC